MVVIASHLNPIKNQLQAAEPRTGFEIHNHFALGKTHTPMPRLVYSELLRHNIIV